MPRRKKAEETESVCLHPDQYMRDIPVSQVLTENYMPYAMSVIKSRALPEIDGLKPAHRKLLYTMYKMGLYGKKIKCANIVGQTMQYNPHGDASIYETLVRLTEANETLLTPFIASKGNFGKHYSRDMAYAAQRYTAAGLTEISKELFEGLNKNAVDMVDNYDGTKKEPVLLPTTFPNILAMPTLGIAVGMASNIPSFNLKELCEAAIEYAKNPASDLLDIMPAPDFTSGGELLYNREEMENIYRTGKGSIILRSKYTVDKKQRRIEITEIPYSTTSEAIVESIVDLCKSKKILEIDDVRDDTDKNGMVITIEYKRSCDPDVLMNKLFRLTPLQDTYNCNFTMLIDGNPVVLGVYDILNEWIKFRCQCIIRQSWFDLAAEKKKLHLYEGLQKIMLNINKAIKIIRETKLDKDVIPNLMQGFKIDEAQAEFIAEIKLRNINEEYILQKTKDIDQLKKHIAVLEKIVTDKKEQKKLMIKKLQEIIKNPAYIRERKTQIVTDYTVEKAGNTSAAVEDYEVKIIITEHGYIKKMLAKKFKSDAEVKIKEDDKVLRILDSNNTGEVLMFTNKGNVYKAKIDDLDICTNGEYGNFAGGLAELEPDEEIFYITATADFKGNMILVFANGKAAKFPLNAYETKQNRKKLINAFYTGEKLIMLQHVFDDVNIDMVSTAGKRLIINTSLINLKNSKTTMGVQVMRLTKGAELKQAKIVSDITGKSEKYVSDRIPVSGLLK